MKSFILPLIIILAVLVPVLFFFFIGKANSSFYNAVRNNETLPDNGRYVKLALITLLTCYGLALIFSLIQNTGLKRAINVESRAEHGAIVIDHVKYITYFKTTQARLVYYISNPVEYLFLNSGELQICNADALLRLVIVIMTAVFLFRFNFDDPFQWEYYKKARRIWGLIFITVLLKMCASWYSNQWVRDHFDHIDTPHYQNNNNYSFYSVMIFMLVISSLFYLYRQGVNNREEIDLTV